MTSWILSAELPAAVLIVLSTLDLGVSVVSDEWDKLAISSKTSIIF